MRAHLVLFSDRNQGGLYVRGNGKRERVENKIWKDDESVKVLNVLFFFSNVNK